MQVNDDIYLGNATSIGVLMGTVANPTLQAGVGPMGRTAFYDVVPLTLAAANLVVLQHTVAATPLTLVAGAGITAGTAPDGSGATVYEFDVPRGVSFTSGANMSAVNLTVVGYDAYGAKMSEVLAGPNTNTVNTLKAFDSVLSITPDATDGVNSLSAGASDVFGLPFAALDGGYLIAKWAGALAADAGTFVAADTTSPATTATGDVRGTYTPSSSSNGTRRLVIWQHLTGAQCGANSTSTGVLGVAQV